MFSHPLCVCAAFWRSLHLSRATNISLGGNHSTAGDLPGLPEIKPGLKGYSVGLLDMYITHTAGTAVSLPCYNPLTGKH